MQGFNKYIPPTYDPQQNPTLNSLTGQASSKEFQVVRFELPLDVVCLSCATYVSKGNRYNAQKRLVGYLGDDELSGIKIWGFRIKCAKCSEWWEIRTDPEMKQGRNGYFCYRGLRPNLKHKMSSVHKGSGNNNNNYNNTTIPSRPAKHDSAKKNNDPFADLESHKAKINYRELQEKHTRYLFERNSRQYASSVQFQKSQDLRSAFRNEKKEHQRLYQEDQKLLLRIGFDKNFKIAKETKRDEALAMNVNFKQGSISHMERINLRQKLDDPIFPNKRLDGKTVVDSKRQRSVDMIRKSMLVGVENSGFSLGCPPFLKRQRKSHSATVSTERNGGKGALLNEEIRDLVSYDSD